MKYFSHQNVTSAKEGVSCAKDCNGKASFIAGGTDLLGILKDNLLPTYPEKLINLKTIEALAGVENLDGVVRIGALTKLSALERDLEITRNFPALASAAASVATPEIRNAATLGGNLCQDTRCWYYRYPNHMGGRMDCPRKGSGPCHAVLGDNRYHSVVDGKRCFAPCPSDTAVALAALGATVEVLGFEGARNLPIEELYSPMGTVLKAEEILTHIDIPAPPPESIQGFKKFTVRKPIDFAIVSIAAKVNITNGIVDGANIFFGAVAPQPYRDEAVESALIGEKFDTKSIAKAAGQALVKAKPLSMNAYKIDIARTLTVELLESFII